MLKLNLIVIILGIKMKTAINFISKLSIKTRPPCLYMLKKKQKMTSLLAGESLCVYWPRYSVSAESVPHLIRTVFFSYNNRITNS